MLKNQLLSDFTRCRVRTSRHRPKLRVRHYLDPIHNGPMQANPNAIMVQNVFFVDTIDVHVDLRNKFTARSTIIVRVSSTWKWRLKFVTNLHHGEDSACTSNNSNPLCSNLSHVSDSNGTPRFPFPPVGTTPRQFLSSIVNDVAIGNNSNDEHNILFHEKAFRVF